MIEFGEALRMLDDAAWELIERTTKDDASLIDVGAAAAAVHVAGAFRRRYGASDQASEALEAEYLTCLSLRLMEIDESTDLAGAMAAAAMITRKPIVTGDEEDRR